MKDWKEIPLVPLSTIYRARYCAYILKLAAEKHDPIQALYQKYKNIPAEVAAHLVHLDMKKPGWNVPPNSLINQVSAELHNVRMLFALCQDSYTLDADEYVEESNLQEVYKALLKLDASNELKKQAAAAAAFCQDTRKGNPACQ